MNLWKLTRLCWYITSGLFAVNLHGRDLPDLNQLSRSFQSLQSINQNTITAEPLQGKVVLLDVWATWCEPCKRSMPFYRELKQIYSDKDFEIVSVSVDEKSDNVQSFLKKLPLPFNVLHDPNGQVPGLLQVETMPSAYLFDRFGKLQLIHAGFRDSDKPVIQGKISQLLTEPQPQMAKEQEVMGTLFKVVLLAEDDAQSRAALDKCFEIFHSIDQVMSEWKPDSALTALNQQAGIAPLKISDDLFEVLQRGRDLSEKTSGRYDITWAPLWGLWKFDGSNRVPEHGEIKARLAFVGWQDLILSPKEKTAFLRRKGMAIGLGSIAKGYALDKAATMLRGLGYTNFLLNAGGQIYAGGKNGNRPWGAGIRDPRGKHTDYFAQLLVSDASLSTSGDYEHAFIKEGKRYHHIIDLKTGQPTQGVRSATVLAKSATLADAYSTAAMVLGPEKALSLAEREGFDLLMIDDLGKVHMSSGMKALVSILRDPIM